MHARSFAVAALAAALVLASCERAAAPSGPAGPSPSAFSHTLTTDLSGYYLPAEPVRAGNWSLHHIFVGQASQFEAWEGGERNAAFAPVMVQFEDATRPTVGTESGESRSRTARVLPTAYEVTDTTVTFSGRSPELGELRFEGRLDPGALATARRNLGGDGVVLTGALVVGGRTFPDVRLRWWMGD